MTSVEKQLSLCRTDCQYRGQKQIPRAAFNQFDVETVQSSLSLCWEKMDASPGKEPWKFFGVSRVAVGDKRLGGNFGDLEIFGGTWRG